MSRNIRHSILSRVRLAYYGMVGISVIILLKILIIQVWQGELWQKKASENGVSFQTIKANRGNILADDGSLLATNLPYYRLAIDPYFPKDTIFNKHIDTLAALLAVQFKEKSKQQWIAELTTARAEKKRYKLLNKEPFDHLLKEQISQWPMVSMGRKAGVFFEKIERRFRPFDNLARRTIGFVQQDSGKNIFGRGLEFSFQHVLAGRDGQAIFQKVGIEQWKPINDGSYIRPEDGLDIQTTINVDLQAHAEQALQKALAAKNADFGSVIIMEVKTGAIKAIVNLSKDKKGNYVEDNNYAVAGLAEPGSTFKIATMAALLEEANINLDDTVQTGDGTYRFYGDAVMTDPKKGGYGKLTVKQAFEVSSNIGISKLVFKYFRKNPEKFIAYLDKFGLTRKLDFQMLGEPAPYIKRPTDPTWSGATLPWMSIGYELKLTPLHTLTFCNALANDGYMVKPYIVKRVLDGNRVIQEFETGVKGERLVSARTVAKMRELMVGVVENGTAKSIRSEYFKMAGKTGTSEKVIGGSYTEQHYTSFVGYFPAEKPMYSCIVIVDNPDGGYGGTAAAPVFQDIADFAYSQRLTRELVPEAKLTDALPVLPKSAYQADLRLLAERLGIKQSVETKEKWVYVRTANDTLKMLGHKMENNIVPNVVGMTMRDAIYVLENKGFKVFFTGKGKVKQQSVLAGTKFNKGDRILLRLG
ncbi:MAG: penicillin-binding protein [Cytophagales bacterium]|nr:transpeptidase family protein [Bernardetiaceae bacterium]MDW8205758.1 penicillin-binding protein [Cytophagales bacterium]